jgi:hypothetical protein
MFVADATQPLRHKSSNRPVPLDRRGYKKNDDTVQYIDGYSTHFHFEYDFLQLEIGLC